MYHLTCATASASSVHLPELAPGVYGSMRELEMHNCARPPCESASIRLRHAERCVTSLKHRQTKIAGVVNSRPDRLYLPVTAARFAVLLSSYCQKVSAQVGLLSKMVTIQLCYGTTSCCLSYSPFHVARSPCNYASLRSSLYPLIAAHWPIHPVVNYVFYWSLYCPLQTICTTLNGGIVALLD